MIEKHCSKNSIKREADMMRLLLLQNTLRFANYYEYHPSTTTAICFERLGHLQPLSHEQ